MSKTLSHRAAALALTLAVLVPGAAFATTIPDRFSISADGLEVTDQSTGLIWRRCAEGQILSANRCTGTPLLLTPLDALQRATTEAQISGVAWRMPNVKELASLVDLSMSPVVDATAFPDTFASDTPSSFHWSSTPFTAGKTRYWGVYFKVGGISNQGKIYKHPIRLVRTGP